MVETPWVRRRVPPLRRLMLSPLYIGYALLGGALQVAALWLMRSHAWSFLGVLPLIVAHQFLFTSAYAKAPNFVAQWFFTAAATGLASFLLGLVVFGDKLNTTHLAGIALVFGGLALLKLG